MPTTLWGEPEVQHDEAYPSLLLKHFSHQMMVQFSAHGASIALYNEGTDQMELQIHVRLRTTGTTVIRNGAGIQNINLLGRRITDKLANDFSASTIGHSKPSAQLFLDELDDVSPQQSELFSVGTSYPLGHDLIGYVWRKNEAHIMSHDEYLSRFHKDRQTPLQTDLVPTSYLVVPIQEPTLADEVRGNERQPHVIGVLILYKVTLGEDFQQKQRFEALNFTERIALYLQLEQLRRAQPRSSDYMQQLQGISATFLSTVKLGALVEKVHIFAKDVVDVSSMLITLYDRDTNKIYDVYAIQNGQSVEGLPAQPVNPEARPQWRQVVLQDKQALLLTSAQMKQHSYAELLTGVWGDQRKAGSFLLLPMKMFNRVIGSLCLTSTQPNAYHREEIQVLETMVQIITVGIENVRLYERARHSLYETKQREELLAAMNSALQSISSVLDHTELLNNFVESAARLVQVEMSVFFRLSPNKHQLIAQAIYAPASPHHDASYTSSQSDNKELHKDLTELIRLPFKGSFLEQTATDAFFYLDPPMVEELAQMSEEGGAIFLRHADIQKMLMVPVRYQTELVGILALHTPHQNRGFVPKEVGLLLAICAQAASAIRSAELFEEIQVAYEEQKRLDKLKDEFLITASHELRTPVSAVMGYSTLLKRHSERINPQDIVRYATKIAGAAQQLTGLVTNLTDAANMSSLDKPLDLQISPVQLLAEVKEAQSAVEGAIQMSSTPNEMLNMLGLNNESKIITHVADDLWVNGDKLSIRQVITNLLDNAVKYSLPLGHTEISASATTLSNVPLPADQVDHEKDPALTVVFVNVKDAGQGILVEDQKIIFEKFVRAPRSLTTPVRGTGLGLYICRRYIEAMGGKLWLAQSISSEGSIFSFYLPRANPTGAEPLQGAF